jgi:predicted TIM-barrel fold metal-dependent hydrolase
LGVGTLLKDQDLVTVIYQVYNTWAAEFCKSNSKRFVALACLPNHDPEVAAEELRRAAKLGLRGADFAVPTAVKPLYHRDWDVLWATAAECRMPISFHSLGWSPRQPDPSGRPALFKGCASIKSDSVSSSYPALFFRGVDRFPEFRFVLGGAAWKLDSLPADRMDHDYEDSDFIDC